MVHKVCLIIYRIKEKGLEVLLVNNHDNGQWSIPEGATIKDLDKAIKLDPVKSNLGNIEHAIAVEGDWHDIPSLRALVKEDMELIKDKIKNIIHEIPETPSSAFFAIKEAFKQVLPHQYAMLKELKEVLTDRNAIINI